MKFGDKAMAITQEQIINLLKNNDLAICRALVVLYNNQTSDEQSAETVHYLNNKGFRPCHAYMGTSMAKQFLSRGFLSKKQISYWRAEGKQGMRIGIYHRQLIEAAAAKEAAKKKETYDEIYNTEASEAA